MKRRMIAALLAALLLAALCGCGSRSETPAETPDYAAGLYGSWNTDLNLTEEAIAGCENWLGHNIDMAPYLGSVSVPVELTFRKDGTCSMTLSSAGYSAALQQVQAGLAAALTDFTAGRLAAAGVNEPGYPAAAGSGEELPDADSVTITNEAAAAGTTDTAALIQQTFGMSAQEYVAQLNAELLPSYDTLCGRVVLTGDFTAETADTLTFGGPAAEAGTVRFLVGESELVITSALRGFDTVPVLFTAAGSEKGGAA